MKVYIKNMVSLRCKIVVEQEFLKLGINYKNVELGEVEIAEDLSGAQYLDLKLALRNVGLELLDDKRSVLIQKIKSAIIELVHYSDEPLNINFSQYLSRKLNHDYTYLSNLFSEVQGITIEKFIIAHKIECVKQLLVYNEFSLTEIAFQMHYSSVAHLSSQFKKVTGLTPSHFKQLKDKKRSNLEDI